MVILETGCQSTIHSALLSIFYNNNNYVYFCFHSEAAFTDPTDYINHLRAYLQTYFNGSEIGLNAELRKHKCWMYYINLNNLSGGN